MQHKLIIITLTVAIGIAILLLGLLIYLRVTTGPTPKPQPLFPAPFATPLPGKITIDGVETNNFLVSPKELNENGDALFVDTGRYQIVYLKQFNQFIIDILAAPFPQVRQEAEQAFLQTLGISKEAACKLRVSIGTSYRVSPDYAGISFPLSFCEQQ